MDNLPITRCKDGLARMSDDQYALSAIRFCENKALERHFKLKILDFFELLGPGRRFPAGIARLFRATRSRKGVSGGSYSTFSSNSVQEGVSGWNCSTFSSNSVQEGGSRLELLDLFEQLGSGSGFQVGVTRLFRATRSRKGGSGWNCSTFSSNSVQEGGFRLELLDFFEQLGSGRGFPVGVTRLLDLCQESGHEITRS